jgi:hypothetical protein
MTDVYNDSTNLDYRKNVFFDRPKGVPYYKIDCAEQENQHQEEGSGALEEAESELY